MDKPYFLEPTLPYKVKEYLKDHAKSNTNKKVDVESMTDHLIANNREFKMKKKKIFIKSVKRAYDWEMRNGIFDLVNDVENSNTEETPDIYEVPIPQSEDKNAFLIDKIYDKPSPQSVKKDKSINCSDMNGNATNHLSNEKVGKNLKKKRKVTSPYSEEIEILDPLKKKKKKKQIAAFIPTLSLKDMEGIEPLLEDIIDLGLNLKEEYMTEKRSWTPKSVLINGPERSGKTMLVSAIAGDYQVNLIRVTVENFMASNDNFDPNQNSLDGTFREALSATPCIVHIEDLHLLSPRDATNNKGIDRRIITQLINKIKDINENHCNKPILVVGEIKYQHSQNIDVSLRSAFEHEIFLPSLNKMARYALLKKLCVEQLSNDEYMDIANRTPSYVAGDLVKLEKKARMLARRRRNAHLIKKSSVYESVQNCLKHYTIAGDVQKEDFLDAIKCVTPTLKREGFPFVPEVKMGDIGGIEDVKVQIRKKILRPIQDPELYEKCGCSVLNGILLYGPPGCGKTLLAKAIANEAALNFLPVNSGEMLKMYQGESERAIREAFRLAASVKPCIIFFDEFDCIATKRVGGTESGSKQSIVNTLLMEMDGIMNRNGVYIMASTNRPDVIDPGVLRPGRIDTKLFVGLPDLDGRVAVLNAVTKNGSRPRLSTEIDLKEISKKCENFTGADCAHLINVAVERAMDREEEKSRDKEEVKATDNQSHSDEHETFSLRLEDFNYALSLISPSVSLSDLKYYQKLKMKFECSKINISKEDLENNHSTGIQFS